MLCGCVPILEERNILETTGGNVLKYGTNVHLDSRMNLLDLSGKGTSHKTYFFWKYMKLNCNWTFWSSQTMARHYVK